MQEGYVIASSYRIVNYRGVQCRNYWVSQSYRPERNDAFRVVILRTLSEIVKPRLHDTTCCQTGCQTGLTTGCIV